MIDLFDLFEFIYQNHNKNIPNLSIEHVVPQSLLKPKKSKHSQPLKDMHNLIESNKRKNQKNNKRNGRQPPPNALLYDDGEAYFNVDEIKNYHKSQSIAEKLDLTEKQIQKIEQFLDISICHINFLKNNVSVDREYREQVFNDPNLDLNTAYLSVRNLLDFLDGLAEKLETSDSSTESDSFDLLSSKKFQKRLTYHLLRLYTVENFDAEDSLMSAVRKIGKIFDRNLKKLLENEKSRNGTRIICYFMHQHLCQNDLFKKM